MPRPSEPRLATIAALCTFGWLAACAAQQASPAPTAKARTMVYECAEAPALVVRVEGDVAWVFAPSGTLSLPRVRSASGEKFEADGSLYWSKGEEAMLDVGGKSYRDCRNDRRRAVWEHAKLNGVDFRATGNEPGWVVEISEKTKIRYVGDYGQQIIESESAPPVQSAEGREALYEVSDGEHRLSVRIVGESCTDTMSGEQFPARVTVTVDERTLHGCGRALH